jgi:hypothetical protein
MGFTAGVKAKEAEQKRQQTQPPSDWRRTIGPIHRSLDLGSRSVSHDCSSYRRRLVSNSIRFRFSRWLLPLVCCSYLVFCASAVDPVRKDFAARTYRLTYLVRKPLLAHLSWIPNITRKIRGLLVHIDKFDQLRIQMGVPKGPVHHQRIVEVLRGFRIVFQSMKMNELCLQATVNYAN